MSKFPIIDKLGGRAALCEAIRSSKALPRKEALQITYHAVRMWEQRGQISNSATRPLWRLALDQGIECTPDDFDLREGTA